MAAKRTRPVASKTFSCGELKDGHKEMIAIKKEAESEDELKKQIQEHTHTQTKSGNILCFETIW